MDLILGLGTFVAALMSYGTYMFISPKTLQLINSPKTLADQNLLARSDLKALLNDISQTQTFKKQITNQISSLFATKPLQPSVLFVLIPNEAKETADCILLKLQALVSKAFDEKPLAMFDCKRSAQLEGKEAKLQLENSLKGLNTSHTAIVTNIEELPPEAAMILHAYCDNENAPFKRALIILTMESSLPLKLLLNRENIRAEVDDRLEKLWNGKVRDVDIPAILSRITNALVLVKAEENKVLEALCPTKEDSLKTVKSFINAIFTLLGN